MSGEPVATVRNGNPDEVQLGAIVIPLLVSAFLVAVVLVYRCRAHRQRRNRLAREHEEELQEINKAAREAEEGEGGLPRRSAAMAGLGNDQYMSAYKKLVAQA